MQWKGGAETPREEGTFGYRKPGRGEEVGVSRGLRVNLLSVLSRAIPASFFAFACVLFWGHFRQTGRLTSLFWMISEGLVVFLLVFRRESKSVSRSLPDWVVALGGSFTVLLVRPVEHALIPDGVGVLLQFLGTAFEIYGKAALGRSFGIVPANRGVIVRGPYRLVRHPIYLGYLVTHAGFLLSNWSAWNAAVYGAVYVFQVLRILSEERYLGRDATYAEYRERVHYRLIPGIF